MRILVLGGTRFIGAAAVRQLAAAGHELQLFNRGRSSLSLPRGVRQSHGDRNAIKDSADDLLAFAPDIVLDMCCITEAQCTAALGVFGRRVGRYLLISSCDVYRTYGVLNGNEEWPVDNTPQDEDAPLRATRYPYRGTQSRTPDDPRAILDDYDKIPCEQAVMALPDSGGTVLRLPMVYGPADYQQRLLPYLRRMDDGRPAILLSTLSAAWRGARGYVNDVAAAIALAVTDSRAAGQVYNVAEAGACSEREWLTRIAAAAGWSGTVVEVDDAALPEELAGLRGSRQHLAVDSNRIRRELGFAEHVDPAAAVKASIDWQRANYPDSLPDGFNYAAEDALLAAL